MELEQAIGIKLQNDFIQIGSIPEQRKVLGKQFPLVITPVEGQKVNFIQLQEYFMKNNGSILKAASEYGAIMFKGFEILTGEEWASIIYQSGIKEMNYVGGAAVRKLVVGTEGLLENPQILTTNESPPNQPIPFHHELAQTPNPPTHISFFCQIPSKEGGSTPLIRSDLVFNFINEKYPEFTEKVEKLGLKYIRTVPEEDDDSSAQGRSWKSMFHVSNKEKAEEAMKNQGFEWEWNQSNGNCKIISQRLDGIQVASNGNKVFFNQMVAAYTGWVDSRNEYGQAVVFGDNSNIPKDIIEDIVLFMEQNSCAYQWTSGQFCIVDNTVTYHSRQIFQGRRRVLATIGKGTKPVNDKVTQLVLTSGTKMPSVGLGCWKIPKEQCAQTTYLAIKNGYRCIDEAADYGNEKECGQGIRMALEEGIVTRQEIFITSKLWNTYHRKEHVRQACIKSLLDLGVDYLDLYLIHFPISLKFVPFEKRYPPEWFYDPESSDRRMEEDHVSYQETWQAMEDLVKEGLVKNIGMCNIGTQTLRDVLSYCTIKPSVLQVEMHPYNSQEKLLKFCREKGIAVTAFSNLGAGSYVELGMATKEESCLEEVIVKDIAQKYQKTPAQIVLRWAVQRGTAIIPKSVQQLRLQENINIFDFYLNNQEMQSITSLNKNRRFNDPGYFCEAAFNTFFPIYE